MFRSAQHDKRGMRFAGFLILNFSFVILNVVKDLYRRLQGAKYLVYRCFVSLSMTRGNEVCRFFNPQFSFVILNVVKDLYRRL